MNKAVVVIKEVGKHPYSVEHSVELEDMQKFVGGYVECVPITDRIDMWVNEEGTLLHLPINFFIRNNKGIALDAVWGNAMFAAHNDEGDIVSLEGGDEIVSVYDMLASDYLLGYSGEVDGMMAFPVMDIGGGEID